MSILNIVANNPTSIMFALGGLGFLAGVQGAGVLLLIGVILQIGWLARFFV